MAKMTAVRSAWGFLVTCSTCFSGSLGASGRGVHEKQEVCLITAAEPLLLSLSLCPPCCKEQFGAKLVALQYCAFQIIYFLIWRVLWAHLPFALFSVLWYFPPCCAHCGCKAGSLLNCSLATWHVLLGRVLCWLTVILNYCSGGKLTAAAGVSESYITQERAWKSKNSGGFHGGLWQSWCVSDWGRWKHIWMGWGIHTHWRGFCDIFNSVLVH